MATLMDDGGVLVFTPLPDGGLAQRAVAVPVGLTDMRVDSVGFLAFGGSVIVGIGVDGGSWQFDADAGPLSDVSSWSSVDGGELVLVVDGELLRSEYRPGIGSVASPEPRSLVPSGCVTSLELERTNRWSEDNFVTTRRSIASSSFESFARSTPVTGDCPLLSGPYTGWTTAGVRLSGAASCPPSVPLMVSGERAFRCLLPDGGIDLTSENSSGSSMFRAAMTAQNQSDLRSVSFAGGPGALWFGAEFTFSPAILDRTPSAMVAVDDLVIALVEQDDDAVQTTYGALLSRGSTLTFPVGNLQGSVNVRGQPEWFAGSATGGTFIGRFTSNSFYGLEFIGQLEGVSEVSSAASVRLPNGGTLLVVGSGDLLMHGVRASDGGVASIQPAVVASSRLPITAISPREDALGGRYAGGYLVAGGRLFRFVADNPVVWRSEEVVTTDDEVIDVWTQNGRSRAGYRDGTLVALPSRVRIAQGSSAPVRQFIPACDRVFALTDVGLEQLVSAPDELEGHWETLFARSGGGRAFFASKKLTVVWSDGSYGELAVPDCAQ